MDKYYDLVTQLSAPHNVGSVFLQNVQISSTLPKFENTANIFIIKKC